MDTGEGAATEWDNSEGVHEGRPNFGRREGTSAGWFWASVEFGLYGSPERQLGIDINDFDETLPGLWEWDVKRLVASFVIAGRHRGFRDEDNRTTVVRSVTERRCCSWLKNPPSTSSMPICRLSGDEAITEFAYQYADQNEKDYKQFVDAISNGQLEADESR